MRHEAEAVPQSIFNLTIQLREEEAMEKLLLTLLVLIETQSGSLAQGVVNGDFEQGSGHG